MRSWYDNSSLIIILTEPSAVAPDPRLNEVVSKVNASEEPAPDAIAAC